MNYPIKRIFALLMALMFCIGAFSSLDITVSAEETEGEAAQTVQETDAYVLSYDGSVEGYAYSGYPYMYKSPFGMSHSYHDPDTGASWRYSYSNEIFHLINTVKAAQGGEGAFASIPVYCTDADTSAQTNAVYRRINLEDSTYHVSGAAARLRAVVLNSFPYVQNMDSITSSANVWLMANGLPEINTLQIGEAMLATQQAIWKISHGDKYTIEDPYTDCAAYDGSGAVSQINAAETETEYTENNITGLYSYLMSLEGIGPRMDAVSEASLENIVYSDVREEDGTYTVTVSVTVNTGVNGGDSMTLSAACNGQVQQLPLTAPGTYSFTFQGLAERTEAELQINGYQTGGDVYLFDSVGDRTASQSLVGYDDSTLPVHAEAVAKPDRIVSIFKSTSKDTGSKPLANIEFDIYRVATLAQLESGQITLGDQPSEADLLAYQNSANYVATVKTDVQGNTSYNFTANGHPDGVYLVVEKFSAATTGTAAPFFVIVPGTSADGSGYAYTVKANPKNVTETGPEIQKDVTQIGNDSDTFGVGDTHTWIIRSGVPAGIGSAEKYVITDTIDYRLTYTQDSPRVKLYTRAGAEIDLTLDTHYALAQGKMDVDGYTVDHFSVSLTKEGMALVAGSLGEGTATAEIRVYFDAVINANAQMGTQIPNQAHLDYTNSAGVDYADDSDQPEVHTGGINLLKTDVGGSALAGATFRIAREATEAEIQAGTSQKLTVDGKELDVVFEDFYASKDLSADKVTEVTTDTEGKAVIYGLAYGTYYIVETKAPAGYNLLTAPIAVTINESSHLTEADQVLNDQQKPIDNTIKIVNTKFIIPDTGGMGTTVFTVAGLAVIGSAALLILLNSKKRKV